METAVRELARIASIDSPDIGHTPRKAKAVTDSFIARIESALKRMDTQELQEIFQEVEDLEMGEEIVEAMERMFDPKPTPTPTNDAYLYSYDEDSASGMYEDSWLDGSYDNEPMSDYLEY